MSAAKKNLTIEQAATFRLKLTWKDAKSRAVNLTGYTARMVIRSSIGGEILLDLVSPTNISLSSTGVIEVVIAANATDAASWSTGVYDLKLFAPNGDEIRLLKGNVTLDPAVTP